MAKKKPAKTPAQVASEYDQVIIANQKRVKARIEKLFDKVLDDISMIAASQQLPTGVFTLDKLPTLNNYIDKYISNLFRNVRSEVISGIKGAWEVSNAKNNYFADIRIKEALIPTDKKVIFYDPNEKALQSFVERKVNGLNLSQRLYKQSEQFKNELEAGIGEGIAVGRSAADMGRQLKQYLKAPDLIFRRVRDLEGKLKLSKNATTFHPGQGVYRSSTKNINRLTRTEINMAYRTSDMARYKKSPFILGYIVKLSAQHPKFDICDFMAGEYPVDFVFTGWHPQCLCFSVPKLMSDTQFAAYQQLVLAGNDTPANIAKIAKGVTDIPESASKWIENNKDKIAGWKKPPYWWDQNSDYVPTLTAEE